MRCHNHLLCRFMDCVQDTQYNAIYFSNSSCWAKLVCVLMNCEQKKEVPTFALKLEQFLTLRFFFYRIDFIKMYTKSQISRLYSNKVKRENSIRNNTTRLLKCTWRQSPYINSSLLALFVPSCDASQLSCASEGNAYLKNYPTS